MAETFKTFRSAKGAKFIWHGSQSDPEIEYKGRLFNYWDIEDALWEGFLETTGHIDEDANNPEVEKEFNKYVQNTCTDYLDMLLYM